MLELPMIVLVMAAPVERKCPNPPAAMPGYEWREPVFVIDGRVRTGEDLEALDMKAGDIDSIEITCWSPTKNAFALDGIPVVRVRTKALVDRTREPLLRLIRAQSAFRSARGRWAGDLDALADFGVEADAALEFETTAAGWSASTPSGDVAYRCSATDATAAEADEEGEPLLDCTAVDALALRSLRARFDAAAGPGG